MADRNRRSGRQTGARNPVSGRRDVYDWRKRRSRNKLKQTIWGFFFIALLGVLTGLFIVYWQQLKQMFKKPPAVARYIRPQAKNKSFVTPSVEEEKPDKNSTKTVPLPETGKAEKVARPKLPPPVGADDGRGRMLLDEGKRLLNELKFKKAAAVFAQGSTLDLSPQLKKELTERRKMADNFYNATKHIKPAPFAVAPEAVRLETVDGLMMQGMLRPGRKPGVYWLERVDNPVSTGSMKLEIAAPEIKQQWNFTLAERRNWFRKIVRDAAADFQPATGSDYYDLVYLCKRLALGPECVNYLEQAYRLDPLLGDDFRKKIVNDRLAHAAMLLAAGRAKRFVEDDLRRLERELPDFEPAKDEIENFRLTVMAKYKENYRSSLRMVAKPKVKLIASKPTKGTGRPDHREPPRKKKPSARELVASAAGDNGGGATMIEGGGGKLRVGGRAQPLVAQADEKYRKGQDIWRRIQAMNFGAARTAKLREAEKYLDAAVETYNKALALDPHNGPLEDRMTEANSFLFWVRKSMPIR